MPYGNGQHKRAAFLVAYAQLGTITHAAEAAKVRRQSHYEWLALEGKDGELYREAFAEAGQKACDSLEREARRRAVEGVEQPVYQGGKDVGTIRKYSDALLIFLMKGAMPDKYADRFKAEHTGAVQHDVRVIVDGSWYGKSDNASARLGPSGGSLALPGPAQGSGVRPAVGQDGNGSDGNGEGPRPT